MEQRTVRSGAIALGGVFALAFAAATLTSTVEPSRDGFGLGDAGGVGIGGGGEPAARPADYPAETLQTSFFADLLSALVLIAAFALLAYLLVYRRDLLGRLVLLVGLVGVLYLFVRLAPLPEGTAEPAIDAFAGVDLFGDGAGTPGSGEGTSPPFAVLVLLGAFLVGIGLLFRRVGSGREPPDDDEPSAEAVGRAAGRAADRLEADVEAENQVYRAWLEMTRLLDVPDSETSTPGDFASAAVDAGLSEADVRELTRLFEDVRYGGRTPDEEYERRARAVFRRIESKYAMDAADEVT